MDFTADTAMLFNAMKNTNKCLQNVLFCHGKFNSPDYITL